MDISTCEEFVGRRVRVAYEDGNALVGMLVSIEPAGHRQEPHLVMDTSRGIAGMPCSIVHSIVAVSDGVR